MISQPPSKNGTVKADSLELQIKDMATVSFNRNDNETLVTSTLDSCKSANFTNVSESTFLSYINNYVNDDTAYIGVLRCENTFYLAVPNPQFLETHQSLDIIVASCTP